MSEYLIFALMAFACDLYASTSYWLSIRHGRTHSHVFSWVVCALTAGIAAGISFYEGAMLTGGLLAVASIINVIIVLSSLRYGTYYIRRIDYLVFVGALAAIPLWLFTKEPFLAAMCISVVSILGDVPTLRKAWELPFEEYGEMYFLFAIISLARLLATQPLNWTTAVYPSIGIFVQLVTVGVIFLRRSAKRKTSQKLMLAG